MVQTLEQMLTMQTIPLKYDINTDLTNITNIMLIDQSVASYDIFVKSANATTFPIVYNRQSTRKELSTLLKSKFTSINRIVIVSHYSPKPIFLESEPLFDSLEVSLSPNSLLIIDLIKTLKVSHIDFLACDTLLYENWKLFYEQLKTNCPGVIIGASNNKTGNRRVSGDWILENTMKNIQSIYFSEMILEYNQLLALTFTINNWTLIYTITSGNNITITGQNVVGDVSLNIPDNIIISDTQYTIISIGIEAFFRCSSLTSVTIGNSVQTIGFAAFKDCTSLTSLTIGDSVQTIGAYAFQGCTSLTSITIPNLVTTIDSQTFNNCQSLTSANIGEGITSIISSAFSGCTSLVTVYFHGNIPTIGNSNFNISGDTAYYISSATNTVELATSRLSMFTNKSSYSTLSAMMAAEATSAATNATTKAENVTVSVGIAVEVGMAVGEAASIAISIGQQPTPSVVQLTQIQVIVTESKQEVASTTDVLKSIVSLIASINKQIAALQKALLKKK